MEQEAAEQVIPLLEERLRIAKQQRETGRVRVSVTTAEESRLVEEVLRHRSVEVERVPVGRQVAEAPSVREEGDTLVIPVMEEVLVVERRLVLREEVRVRLRVEERPETIPMTLRRQTAAIERLPPALAPHRTP
ncbi:YsnF/AvaK domain-containing protein [Dankookia sp. P2]|uniref:YsnF/AvaK domain-containing protein n=1 Tax=Dankookia sp. P2 TaxID=3423955 RepID=UPI003D668002